MIDFLQQLNRLNTGFFVLFIVVFILFCGIAIDLIYSIIKLVFTRK